MQPIGEIRWKCRRGMLELDVILERFMGQRYHQLTKTQQAEFARLLEAPDPLLYAWFVGSEVPQDKAQAAMVEYIIKD